MIRKGRFALWRSKEYELISYQRQYYLQSENEFDVQHGFVKSAGKEVVFLKPIAVKELEHAYEVFPYAMISGYRFAVEGYNDKMNTVALVTNNPFVKKKVGVRPYGKHEYIIEIPYGEVEIKEDWIPILGFENVRN